MPGIDPQIGICRGGRMASIRPYRRWGMRYHSHGLYFFISSAAQRTPSTAAVMMPPA